MEFTWKPCEIITPMSKFLRDVKLIPMGSIHNTIEAEIAYNKYRETYTIEDLYNIPKT